MVATYFDGSVLAFVLELKPRKFHYHKESKTLVTVYWCVGTFVVIYLQYRCGVLFSCGKCFLGPQFKIN